MTASEVSGSGFRARTGVLTLLYAASSVEREVLLEMLAELVLGVSMYDEEAELDEDFDEELDDDLDEDAFDPNVVLDPLIVETDEEDLEPDGLIGPDTPMRITPAGEELLFVAFAMERWLRNSPDGPRELGENDAGRALTALAGGWATTAMHALARGPHTLEELSAAVKDVSYQVLEERVEAMERARQVQAQVDSDGETRYAPTVWLQEAIAPLIAATRLERRYPQEDTVPPDSLDVEAAFHLSLPLLELPGELSGSCRLALQMPGDAPHLAGVMAEVGQGRVISCSTQLEEAPETWATGSTEDWLETVMDPDIGRVKAGGDTRLAGALLSGLHETLFGIPVR